MSDDTSTIKTGTTESENTESHAFRAETARLLHLLIHSVYSDKEIFLRELISNAADACDKLRYEAISKPDLIADDSEFKITIVSDPEAKTLVVEDNGIGMNHDELIENLGTIARSGTKAFLDQLKESADGTNLIGQFGVGFYSAFMVADRIDVISCHAGEKKAWHWQSDGTETFAIQELGKKDADYRMRGTMIRLHISDESAEFLDEHRIKRIVSTYSSHIPVPIHLIKVEDEKPSEPEQLGDATALWTRPKSEIKSEEYKEFYGQVSGYYDEPLRTIHYRAEGRQEYSVLAFIPGSQPFDLFDPARKSRMKLYVRRVFITDEADLLPPYLRFVRGIVDSEDIPLNISREMLQNNPLLEIIGKGIASRVLSEITKIADKEPDNYLEFWNHFGAVLKEGLYEDPERRDALLDLTRLKTTASDEWRSLKDYVGAMKENQTAIYYMTGDDAARLKASPQLEGYKARGIEVLLLSDPVDNFWTMTALGYDGKSFKSITQGEADLAGIPLETKEGDDKPAEKAEGASFATLLAMFKDILGDAVSEVRESDRLTDSASCLVAAADGPDRNLEKMMAGQGVPSTPSAPILEINSGHALVRSLTEKANKKKARPMIEDIAWLLLDQARIVEGESPIDAAAFSRRLTANLTKALD